MTEDKRRYLYVGVIIGLVLGIGLTTLAKADEVRQSKSGICHCEGSNAYETVKNFTAFDTLEQCIAAGGREPKKGQGVCPAPVLDSQTVTIEIGKYVECTLLYHDFVREWNNTWSGDPTPVFDKAIKKGCWIKHE